MHMILIDSSVWISFFNDRSSTDKNLERHQKATVLFDYFKNNHIKPCYESYIERELLQKNEVQRQQKLKQLGKKIPSYGGNDSWEEIDIKWEDCGSLWNNDEEIVKEQIIEKQLPDKKKSNRNDRKITLALVQTPNIIALIHENPKDFNKINIKQIPSINSNLQIIDLLNTAIEDVKNTLSYLCTKM